jgi:hypothetical protein
VSISFPSLDFFNRLKERMADEPAQGVPESDAYCGLVVDDQLFVLEFDGDRCSAVAQGGNLLDLDFALAAPADTWRELLRAIHAGDGGPSLEALLDEGRLEVQGENDDGPELARAALPMIQAYLGQSWALDLDFS